MKRLAALVLMVALCLAVWPVEARAGDEFRLVARQKQTSVPPKTPSSTKVLE